VASSITETVRPPAKTADEMSDHVNLSAARDHAVDRFLRRVQAGERDGKRNEIRVVEVRLLDSRESPTTVKSASGKAFVT
jgi:hypothetical protein